MNTRKSKNVKTSATGEISTSDLLGSARAVCDAIEERSGSWTEMQWSEGGIAIGVPSAKKDVLNLSLLPIDLESRKRFVDFMCSLVGKKPKKCVTKSLTGETP